MKTSIDAPPSIPTSTAMEQITIANIHQHTFSSVLNDLYNNRTRTFHSLYFILIANIENFFY